MQHGVVAAHLAKIRVRCATETSAHGVVVAHWVYGIHGVHGIHGIHGVSATIVVVWIIVVDWWGVIAVSTPIIGVKRWGRLGGAVLLVVGWLLYSPGIVYWWKGSLLLDWRGGIVVGCGLHLIA